MAGRGGRQGRPWERSTALAVVDVRRLTDEDMRAFAGQWVAIKDGRVLKASESGAEVIAWVERTGERPDLVMELPSVDEPTDWML